MSSPVSELVEKMDAETDSVKRNLLRGCIATLCHLVLNSKDDICGKEYLVIYTSKRQLDKSIGMLILNQTDDGAKFLVQSTLNVAVSAMLTKKGKMIYSRTIIGEVRGVYTCAAYAP